VANVDTIHAKSKTIVSINIHQMVNLQTKNDDEVDNRIVGKQGDSEKVMFSIGTGLGRMME